jgi:hypothetical protein
MMRTGKFRGFEVALHDPGVAVVTFNRPERLNGTTAHVKRDLVETLLQALMDDAVRVVVFTGQGRAFCAGDEIAGCAPEFAGASALVPEIPQLALQQLLQQLHRGVALGHPAHLVQELLAISSPSRVRRTWIRSSRGSTRSPPPRSHSSPPRAWARRIRAMRSSATSTTAGSIASGSIRQATGSSFRTPTSPTWLLTATRSSTRAAGILEWARSAFMRPSRDVERRRC